MYFLPDENVLLLLAILATCNMYCETCMSSVGKLGRAIEERKGRKGTRINISQVNA